VLTKDGDTSKIAKEHKLPRAEAINLGDCKSDTDQHIRETKGPKTELERNTTREDPKLLLRRKPKTAQTKHEPTIKGETEDTDKRGGGELKQAPGKKVNHAAAATHQQKTENHKPYKGIKRRFNNDDTLGKQGARGPRSTPRTCLRKLKRDGRGVDQ